MATSAKNSAFYDINYTDPLRSSFKVPRKGLDGPGEDTTNTPLFLYGRGALEWGEYVDENMLRLLEIHAGATPPKYAICGQLWSKQILYWRNSSKVIPAASDDPVDNFMFYYDIDTSTWKPLEVIVTNNVDDVVAIEGTHVYHRPDDTLYLYSRAYNVDEVEPVPRLYKTKDRDPNIDDRVPHEVMTLGIDGEWKSVGFRNNNTELSVNLNTLGSHDAVGSYYQHDNGYARIDEGYPMEGLSGSLIVLPSQHNTVVQVYTTHNARTFVRFSYNGAGGIQWSDWEERNLYENLKGKPVQYPPTPHSHQYYRDISNRPNNTGMITAWPVNNVPDHVIVCDGRAVSREVYAELFDVIGTTYGDGDGSTTFNVPDYRDMFLRHTKSGRAVGNVQDDMVKSHNHSGSSAMAGDHNHVITTTSAGAHNHALTVASAGSHNHNISVESAGNHSHSISVQSNGAHTHTGSASSAGGHSHSLSINSGGSHTHSVTGGSVNIPTIYLGEGAPTSGGFTWHGGNRPSYKSAKYEGGTAQSAGSHTHTGSVASSGNHTHSVSVASAGSHSHSASSNTTGSHSHSASSDNSGSHIHSATSAINGSHVHPASSNVTGSHNHAISIANTGGVENRPKNIAVVYAIVAYS